MSFGLKHLCCALLALCFVLLNKLGNLGLVICFLLGHSAVMTCLKLLHLGLQLRQFGGSSVGFRLLLCTTGLGGISVRTEWELRQQKIDPKEKKETRGPKEELTRQLNDFVL